MSILTILQLFVALIFLIVIFGFINEKLFHLTTEIALMLFAFILGAIFFGVNHTFGYNIQSYLTTFPLSPLRLHLDHFLVEGILCFMLFAGASKVRWKELEHNLRLVSTLALLTTFLTVGIYGGLFYVLALLLQIDISFTLCLLLGCIIAPTDPIAATSILPQFGLPKNISIVVEGESLFNDGVGIAIYLTIAGMLSNGSGENFLIVMFRELFGALAIGYLISFIAFKIFINTNDAFRQVAVSLLAVSSSYIICEKIECSGAIAAVVCGIYFATNIHQLEESKKKNFIEFYDFWDITDNLLNSILYIMLGFSFVFLIDHHTFIFIGVGAIVINLISRCLGVFFATLLSPHLPDGYTKTPFVALLTWGGLKGGLSLALAMSSQDLLSAELYNIFLCATYFVVFFTTIVQGLSMKLFYNKWVAPFVPR